MVNYKEMTAVKEEVEIMYDIVIIGAGTAGLSAAIYGARAGKRVLVLEESMYGGQIVNSPNIENYPGITSISGYEFSMKLYEQATGLGAEYKPVKVTGIDKRDNYFAVQTSDTGDSSVVETKTVILATGAKHKTLAVPGEDKLKGAGVSYCATCDGAFFRNQEVAVVGGGNTALTDAAFLSDSCKKVYVIHRRDTFRGEARLAEVLQGRDNVEFILNSRVKSVNGDFDVDSLTLEHTATGELSALTVQGVFVAIGQAPDNEKFRNLVALDETGYVAAGEDCRTSCPGIFAAGDCRTKSVRQLATAASDGAVAALAACEFIMEA